MIKYGIISSLVIVSILQGLIVLGGILLLVIPGIIFIIWYAFATMAVILEEKRPREALAFSHSLVRGRFSQYSGALPLQ